MKIDIEVARAMREAGATYQQIADRFGVARQAAHAALNKKPMVARAPRAPRKKKSSGLAPLPRPRKVDYAEVADLRRAGLTHREIAERSGCSVFAVRRALCVHAPEMVLPYGESESGGPAPLMDASAIRTMRAEGASIKDIAAAFGVGRISVGLALRGQARGEPPQEK